MLPALLASFAISVVLTLWVVRLARRRLHLFGDSDLSGPQKFHARVVPRVGGIGIAAGFAGAMAVIAWQQPKHAYLIACLVASAVPVFASGLWEDLTKRVRPRNRLLAAAASAALAAWLLGAVLARTDIPGVQWIAGYSMGALVLTLFVVSGVVNSVNIIDGMNGLASMCCIIMLAGLAYVGQQAGDPVITLIALATIGAIAGFFIWNYPNGLIFLGDGGAYLLGFLLAEVAILLIHRNPEVSPLCPLLMVAYPVMETLFTMYRRRVVRGHAMALPDGIHLHSLVYRRLMRWAVGSNDAKQLTRRNSLTAPYLWVVCSLSVVPSLLWWDSTPILAACLLFFVVLYVSLYARIVRFRTPRWMVFSNSRQPDIQEHRQV
jgi:UDP-N-acetylmuramyl pentapeptide phosphotransferase/UDP-N-acetylglucosamine-1-phosphate transferase